MFIQAVIVKIIAIAICRYSKLLHKQIVLRFIFKHVVFVPFSHVVILSMYMNTTIMRMYMISSTNLWSDQVYFLVTATECNMEASYQNTHPLYVINVTTFYCMQLIYVQTHFKINCFQKLFLLESVSNTITQGDIALFFYALSLHILTMGSIIYSNLMSEKSIDQNIFSEVLGTARCFLLPEANGRGQQNASSGSQHRGETFWSID